MCTRRGIAALLALGCLASLPGCGAHSFSEVPAPWLRAARPDGPAADGYGAWISLYGSVRRSSRLRGELIACDRDSMWVLTDSGLAGVETRHARGLTVYTGLGPDGETESWSMSGADPRSLRPWARFPQGIPADLDRALIRPRP